MRLPDPLRLRDEPEQRSVAIETPCATALDHRETVLVMPKQELAANRPLRAFESQLQRLGPEPLDVHDGYPRTAASVVSSSSFI